MNTSIFGIGHINDEVTSVLKRIYHSNCFDVPIHPDAELSVNLFQVMDFDESKVLGECVGVSSFYNPNQYEIRTELIKFECLKMLVDLKILSHVHLKAFSCLIKNGWKFWFSPGFE